MHDSFVSMDCFELVNCSRMMIVCKQDFNYEVTKNPVVQFNGKLNNLKSRYCISNAADS
jgi:hypothetical protein